MIIWRLLATFELMLDYFIEEKSNSAQEIASILNVPGVWRARLLGRLVLRQRVLISLCSLHCAINVYLY